MSNNQTLDDFLAMLHPAARKVWAELYPNERAAALLDMSRSADFVLSRPDGSRVMACQTTIIMVLSIAFDVDVEKCNELILRVREKMAAACPHYSEHAPRAPTETHP